MKKIRVAVAALSLSAAGFVGLLTKEGWTERAVIPVKGDVPTVGPGLTKRPDGSPVQMGDTIKPLEGIQRSFSHIAQDESRLKQCVRVPLTQTEYDMLVDHAYQYGAARTCNSQIVRLTNQQKYAEACKAYLNWKYVAGRDCSIRSNGCYGVWVRSQQRMQKCLG